MMKRVNLLLAFCLVIFMTKMAAADQPACANQAGTCACREWPGKSYYVAYWDGGSWIWLTNLMNNFYDCIKELKTDPKISMACGK